MKKNEKKMKKKSIRGRTGAALVLLLGMAACDGSFLPGPMDRTVRFGVSTSYRNGSSTRTEYSGVDENGFLVTSDSEFERIDWVADLDRIRIVCAQANGSVGNSTSGASGDYIIGTSTADREKSSAPVTPTDETTPFYWSEGVEHTFYALYPAPGTTSNYHSATVTEAESNLTSLDGDRALVTGSIPAVQSSVKKSGTTEYKPNMNLAYMYAQERLMRPDDNSVQLSFKPLVTAFEFSLKALDDAMSLYDLESVSLTSTSSDLAGDFTVTLDYGASGPVLTPTAGTTGRTVKVTLPAGTRLDNNNATVVTLLALGLPQTNLTVSLNFSDGHSRSLLLKKANGDMISVGACKKAYFRLGVPSDEIFFEVTPMTSFDASGAPSYPVATRGMNEIDNSSDRGITEQRFGVFALRNAENVPFNPATNPMDLYLDNHDTECLETLSSGNTYWHGSPSAYWPSFDRLNFFAFAPYQAGQIPAGGTVPPLVFPSADYTAGMPRATYTPSALVNNQADLCIGTPRFNLMKDDNPVPLTFRHALTYVRLYVRLIGTSDQSTQPRSYEYRVTNAVLSGLVGTNTFTYQDSESAPFVWDAVTASTPLDAEYKLKWDTSPAASLDVEWLKFVGDSDIGSGETDPYTWITRPDNGRMYLLPQTTTSDATLQLSISMYRPDPSDRANSPLQAILPPFDVPLPAGTVWEPGHSVFYLVTVDITRLVVVDVKAMVSEWEDAGNTHGPQTIF